MKGVSIIGWLFDIGGYGGKVGFGKDVLVGGVVYIFLVFIFLLGFLWICFEYFFVYFIVWFGWEFVKFKVDLLDEYRKRVKI